MIVTRGKLIEWALGVEGKDVRDVLDMLGGVAEVVEGFDPDALDPDEAVEILVSEDDSEGLHGTEVERVADGSYHVRGYLECYAEGETWEQAIGALRQVARDCQERDTVWGRLNWQEKAHNQLVTEMHPELACVSCRWGRVAETGSRACDLPMLGDVHRMSASVGVLMRKLLLAQAASPGGCPCHEPAEVRIREKAEMKKYPSRGSVDREPEKLELQRATD